MKSLFAAVILGTSLLCQAQELTTQKAGKWAIGASFSPDYSYRRLIYDRQDPLSREVAKRNEANDFPQLGITTGINLQRKIGGRFAFETGLQFSQQGYRHVEKDIDYSNYRWFAPPGKLPKDIDQKFTDQFLKLPIRLNYYTKTGKYQFTSSIAVLLGYQFAGIYSSVATYDDGSVSKRYSRYTESEVDLGAQLSAGLNYNFNTRSSFRIEPTFRYTFGNSWAYSTPYNCGMNLSYFLHL